jgi:hypothetical protein
MQKLKLNFQTLSYSAEVLTRSQLKNVLGGVAGVMTDGCSTHIDWCSANCPCPNPFDYCNFTGHCVQKPL